MGRLPEVGVLIESTSISLPMSTVTGRAVVSGRPGAASGGRSGSAGTPWRADGCSAAGRSRACPANIELPPYDTKGRGTPVTGMMPRHIPMFWKAWKPNQQAIPAAATRPKTSSTSPRSPAPARSRTPSSAISTPAPTRPSSSPATVKMKSVCCSGTKPDAGLRAVEEPLAEQSAVADRDPCLLGVVAGSARVEVGVGEGQEAVDLVGLEQVSGEGRHRGGRRRPRPAATSQRRGAPATASTPKTVAESTSMVPRSGWSMISAAGMPAMTSMPTHVDARRPAAAASPRRARRPAAPSR